MDAYISNYWFNNLIKNKINTEILLLILPLNLKTNNIKRKKFEDRFSKLKMTNYKLIDIHYIKSFNEVEKDKNIIILGHPMMNVELLNNLQHNILCISLLHTYKYFLSDNHIENIGNISTITLEDSEDNYLNFYKQRDPTILLKKLPNIFDYIFGLSLPQEQAFNFISRILPGQFNYKYRGRIYYSTWEHIIEADIYYLQRSHILTARLAILIYKLTTYKFDDSHTKIGIYYKQKLGVKSKTVRLPQKMYRIPELTVKAYDLTHYFNLAPSRICR